MLYNSSTGRRVKEPHAYVSWAGTGAIVHLSEHLRRSNAGQTAARRCRLDRQANPQRYRLLSGAELVKVNIANYNNPSLHIWTQVGDERFDDVKFQIDYDLAQQHFNRQITDEELVNAVFEPQEQVSPAQMDLLGAAFMLATAGLAQARVGTGAGGSHSDLPWDGKKNNSRRR